MGGHESCTYKVIFIRDLKEFIVKYFVPAGHARKYTGHAQAGIYILK